MLIQESARHKGALTRTCHISSVQLCGVCNICTHITLVGIKHNAYIYIYTHFNVDCIPMARTQECPLLRGCLSYAVNTRHRDRGSLHRCDRSLICRYGSNVLMADPTHV